jgi:hypothetical protein
MAIGAILTFAITGHPSFLNVQVTGLVIMAAGLAGLLLPRRGRAWLHAKTVMPLDSTRQVVRRRTTRSPRYAQYQLSPGVGDVQGNGFSADPLAEPPTTPDLLAEDVAADGLADRTEITETEVTTDGADAEVIDEYVEGD